MRSLLSKCITNKNRQNSFLNRLTLRLIGPLRQQHRVKTSTRRVMFDGALQTRSTTFKVRRLINRVRARGLITRTNVMTRHVHTIRNSGQPYRRAIFGAYNRRATVVNARHTSRVKVITRQDEHRSVTLTNLSRRVMVFKRVNRHLVHLVNGLNQTLTRELTRIATSAALRPDRGLVVTANSISSRNLIMQRYKRRLLHAVNRPNISARRHSTLINLLSNIRSNISSLTLLDLNKLNSPHQPVRQTRVVVAIHLGVSGKSRNSRFAVALSRVVTP